jgi:radical SAM/Cys-rich protein
MYPEQVSQWVEEHGSAGSHVVEPFLQALSRHGLKLVRGRPTTLQVNMGLLCNLACRHCHLRAGPDRSEIMDAETADHVISYARRVPFEVIDITGGAPELNPNLVKLIEGASSVSPRIMLRSNLSALNYGNGDRLLDCLQAHRVVIVASLPSLNVLQVNAQRGEGIFRKSIAALRRLNGIGYGIESTGLELNLVSNPTGAFVPSSQNGLEKRFHQVLKQRWGIAFNQLFAFANVPLGRFREWLVISGNLESYLVKLASAFNPCAVEGLMCRTLVSVSWDGYFYDCDFNLAEDLPMGGKKTHVTEITGPPEPGSPIAVAEHCYACTAGAGFT